MTTPHHQKESTSNHIRDNIARLEPRSLRTYTPTQAVLSKSAGVYHWTVEGKRLYDYSSGVLVANLGHNPRSWMRRFYAGMAWDAAYHPEGAPGEEYVAAAPMTAYNAVSLGEVTASERLGGLLQSRPG